MKTIIFDLDGTLANIDHRIHHVRNGNHNWDAFFAECVNDTPVKAVVELYQQLSETTLYRMVIVSGRSDIVREETVKWLTDHEIWFEELIMRPNGDYTPDHILKETILDKLLADGHDILFTVDDRQRVVDMWRRRGVTCLQAAAWEEQGKISKPQQKGLLTLMVGPSGAGKSHFLNSQYMPLSELEGMPGKVRNTIASSHIISSDQIRMDLCGNFRDQTKNDQVFAALHAVVKTRIDHGLPAVVDATNIKRVDRLACVKLAEGSPVRYIVIDRPLEEKKRDGGWRNELPIDLIAKHHQTFQSNLKDILKGDGQPNVEVIDLRKVNKT